jgi:hypothetical protein
MQLRLDAFGYSIERGKAPSSRHWSCVLITEPTRGYFDFISLLVPVTKPMSTDSNLPHQNENPVIQVLFTYLLKEPPQNGKGA